MHQILWPAMPPSAATRMAGRHAGLPGTARALAWPGFGRSSPNPLALLHRLVVRIPCPVRGGTPGQGRWVLFAALNPGRRVRLAEWANAALFGFPFSV